MFNSASCLYPLCFESRKTARIMDFSGMGQAKKYYHITVEGESCLISSNKLLIQYVVFANIAIKIFVFFDIKLLVKTLRQSNFVRIILKFSFPFFLFKLL